MNKSTRWVLNLLVLAALAVSATGSALAQVGPPPPAPGGPAGSPPSPAPHPILSDVRVRQAIAYCTNKDALIAAAYPDLTADGREALYMDTFISPDNWAYTVPTTTYPYSPTVGENLLDTAGWTLGGGDYRVNAQGKELVLSLTTTTAAWRATYLAVFTDQMKACGIHVLFNPQPAGWWFGTQTGVAVRDFEMGVFMWCFTADPGVYLYDCNQVPSPGNAWTGQNASGWCNATVQADIPLATSTQLTQAERKTYYAVIQDEFMKDVPTLGLFSPPDNRPGEFCWEHMDLNLETYTQQIDVTAGAGGVLNYTDFSGNQGSVAVPAGGVTQTVGLAYTPLVAPGNTLPESQAAAVAFRLTAMVAGVPQSTFAFSQPVTLTVPYRPPDAAGIWDVNSLNLYYWNGSAWVGLLPCAGCGVDTVNHRVTVTVDHLTEFALMGKVFKVYLPLARR